MTANRRCCRLHWWRLLTRWPSTRPADAVIRGPARLRGYELIVGGDVAGSCGRRAVSDEDDPEGISGQEARRGLYYAPTRGGPQPRGQSDHHHRHDQGRTHCRVSHRCGPVRFLQTRLGLVWFNPWGGTGLDAHTEKNARMCAGILFSEPAGRRMEVLKVSEPDWLTPSDRSWALRLEARSDGDSRTSPHRASIRDDAWPVVETLTR